MNKFYEQLRLYINITLFILTPLSAIAQQYTYVANTKLSSISPYEVTYGIESLPQIYLGCAPKLVRVNPVNKNVIVICPVITNSIYPTNRLLIFNPMFAKNGMDSLVERPFDIQDDVKDIQIHKGRIYIICRFAIYLWVSDKREAKLIVSYNAYDEIRGVSFSGGDKVFVNLITVSGETRVGTLEQYTVNNNGSFSKNVILKQYLNYGSKVVIDKPEPNYLYFLRGKEYEHGYAGYSGISIFTPPPSYNESYDIENEKYKPVDLISVNDLYSKASSYAYIAYSSIISVAHVFKGFATILQEIKLPKYISNMSISDDGLDFYVIVTGENKIYKYNRDIFEGKLINAPTASLLPPNGGGVIAASPPIPASRQYAYVVNTLSKSISSYDISNGLIQSKQTALGCHQPYLVRVNPVSLDVFVVCLYDNQSDYSKVFIFDHKFSKKEEFTKPFINDIQFYDGRTYLIYKDAIHIYLVGRGQLSDNLIASRPSPTSVSFSVDNKVFVQTTRGLQQYDVDKYGKFVNMEKISENTDDSETKIVADKPKATYLYQYNNKDHKIMVLNDKFNYSIEKSSEIHIPNLEKLWIVDVIGVNTQVSNNSYAYIALKTSDTSKPDDQSSTIRVYGISESYNTLLQTFKSVNPISAMSMSNDNRYLYVTVARENTIYRFSRDISSGRLNPVPLITNTGYGPVSMALTPYF